MTKKRTKKKRTKTTWDEMNVVFTSAGASEESEISLERIGEQNDEHGISEKPSV